MDLERHLELVRRNARTGTKSAQGTEAGSPRHEWDHATHVELRGMGWFVGHRPTIVAVPVAVISAEKKATGVSLTYQQSSRGADPSTTTIIIKKAGRGVRNLLLTALSCLLPPQHEALPIQLFDAVKAVPIVFRPLLFCIIVHWFDFEVNHLMEDSLLPI